MRMEDWCKATERPQERELRRKLRRAAIGDMVGGLLMVAAGFLFLLLYLVATPQWSSAIEEAEEEESGLKAAAPIWAGSEAGKAAAPIWAGSEVRP